jgi:hypothetical protein
MSEDHGLMYSGWDKEGNYTYEWMDKTIAFLDRAFSLSKIVWCPYSSCQNIRCLEVLDSFDADCASDAKNVHFELATNSFDPFSSNSAP